MMNRFFLPFFALLFGMLTSSTAQSTKAFIGFDPMLNKQIQQINTYDGFEKQRKELAAISKKDPNHWVYAYYRAYTHLYTYYYFANMTNANEKKRKLAEIFGEKLTESGEPFERIYLNLAMDEINLALTQDKQAELYNLKAYLYFLLIKHDKDNLFPTYQNDIETCLNAGADNNGLNPNNMVLKALLNYYGPEHIYGGISNALILATEAKSLYSTMPQIVNDLPNWSEKALNDHIYMLEKLAR